MVTGYRTFDFGGWWLAGIVAIRREGSRKLSPITLGAMVFALLAGIQPLVWDCFMVGFEAAGVYIARRHSVSVPPSSGFVTLSVRQKFPLGIPCSAVRGSRDRFFGALFRGPFSTLIIRQGLCPCCRCPARKG